MAPPVPPLNQPHDHLFRLVFADPDETAAFLRVSDLLFEVRSSAAAPRQWLYLLFEHQS